jgi:hypothetical protein
MAHVVKDPDKQIRFCVVLVESLGPKRVQEGGG